MTHVKFLRALDSFSPLYGLDAIRKRVETLYTALKKQRGDPMGQIKTVHQIEHLSRTAETMIEAREHCRRASVKVAA